MERKRECERYKMRAEFRQIRRVERQEFFKYTWVVKDNELKVGG